MKHRYIGLCIGMCFMLSSCRAIPAQVAAAPSAGPAPDPTIAGVITALDPQLVVETEPGTTTGDKVAFSVTPATRVYRQTESGPEPLANDTLAVGQHVAVWAEGPIAQSFPRQAVARDIELRATNE